MTPDDDPRDEHGEPESQLEEADAKARARQQENHGPKQDKQLQHGGAHSGAITHGGSLGRREGDHSNAQIRCQSSADASSAALTRCAFGCGTPTVTVPSDELVAANLVRHIAAMATATVAPKRPHLETPPV